MSHAATVRANLRDLQRNNLTTVVSAVYAIHAAEFGPCDDPICEQYGHLHYERSMVERAEARARRKAAETLSRLGWTPDLFTAVLHARLDDSTLHRLGLDNVVFDLFPELR